MNLIERTRKLEKLWLEKAMADAKGNKSQAARALGINRTTLIMKLKSHGIFRVGSNGKQDQDQ